MRSYMLQEEAENMLISFKIDKQEKQTYLKKKISYKFIHFCYLTYKSYHGISFQYLWN